MNEAMTLIEQYAKVFEDCVMSENPRQFINSQPDSFEKKLLQYISQEHSEKYVEDLKELKKKNRYFWEFLEKHKATSKVLSATTASEVEYILKDMIKEKEGQFNYTRPVDYHTN